MCSEKQDFQQISLMLLSNSHAFDKDDDGNTEIHKRHVKRGKVLLKLLSTIGNASFFEWLKKANTVGNFYEFDDYRIVKKSTLKKDVLNIDDLPKIIKASQELMASGSEFEQFLKKTDLVERGYNIKDIGHFFPAFTMLLGKMCNIIQTPKYQVGEIYTHDDMVQPTSDVDLINLYKIQERIETYDEAVDRLATLPFINVSDDIFKAPELDARKHWAFHPVTADSYKLKRSSQFQYIEFHDNDKLQGSVLINDNGLIKPQTYWSNDYNCPGRPLAIPFPIPYPLWNKDLIDKNKDTTVFLTDSLCTAYHAYNSINNELKEIEFRLNILKQKDSVCYQHAIDENFENELREYVIQKLKEFDPNFEIYNYEISRHYLAEYHEARAILRTGLKMFKFTDLELGNDITTYKDLPDLALAKDLDEIKKCFTNHGNKLNIDLKELNIKKKFYVFKKAYMLIEEYIQQCQEKDKKEIKSLEEQIAKKGIFIWSSWYGGANTVVDVDYSPLRHRNVVYIIRCHNEKDYSTAFKFYQKAHKLAGCKITFVDYECIVCQSPKERKKLIRHCIGDDNLYQSPFMDETCFLDIAQEKFSINFNTITIKENTTKVIDAPDAYDTQKDHAVLKENEFILSPLIRENSISLLYSEPGVGKTWLALSIANSLVYGCNTFTSGIGWDALRPRRVLLIDSEMSLNSFFNRLRMLKDYYGNMVAMKEHHSPLQLYYKLVAQEGWDLADEDDTYRDRITKWLKLGCKDQIDFLILDNLSTLSGFNDSGKSWKQLFVWLQNLRDRGCSSLILHHANKTTGDQRGSSIKSATVDNIIRVRKALPGKNNNVAISIEIEKGRDAYGAALNPFNVMLKVEKGKASWATTMAKGTQSVSNAERNRQIMQTLKSGAFSQQIIADYFGLELSTLKGIVRKANEHETFALDVKVDQIIKLLSKNDSNSMPYVALKQKLMKILHAKPVDKNKDGDNNDD